MNTTSQLTAEQIPDIELKAGGHGSPAQGVCLLEAVAWFAGEDHTDHPACVSPFLGAYGRRLNDRLPDADRQKLKPFITRMVGTAGDGYDEERRNLAVDWAARVGTPRLLDAAGMTAEAAELRALAPVVDRQTRLAAWDALRRVSDATWEIRKQHRQAIKDAVTAELQKQKPGTDAVAVAVADAAAVAVAVAVAAADAVAVAVAVADAAAAAVAAAAADADAAAAAVADAAADAAAAADADADWHATYSDVYWAVRRELEKRWTDALNDSPLAVAIRLNRQDGIDLLGRMINPAAGEEQAA